MLYYGIDVARLTLSDRYGGCWKLGAYLVIWWRRHMETFSALLALCAGNSPVLGEFPAQRPVTLSFDVFFDLCLIKRLRKQSWGWWFETLSRPLWRRCNVRAAFVIMMAADALVHWRMTFVISIIKLVVELFASRSNLVDGLLTGFWTPVK